MPDCPKQIRQRIIQWGGEVRFESKLTDIQTENGILKTVTINEEVFPCQTVSFGNWKWRTRYLSNADRQTS